MNKLPAGSPGKSLESKMHGQFKRPKKQIEKSLEELQKIAKETSRNPRLFFSILGLNFLVCTLAYYPYLGLGKAFLNSVLFTALWALIFVLLPYVFNLLIGLIFFGVVIYAFVVIYQAAGLFAASVAILGGIIALALVLGLFLWVAFLLPGLFLGLSAYKFMGEGTLAVSVGVGVFLTTSAVVYFLLRYVIPFLTGFCWASVTGLLAQRMIGSVFYSETLSEIAGSYDTYQGFWGRFEFIRDQLLLSMKPPLLLGVWIFILSVVLGVFVARPASRKKQPDKT
jgi:hypothetical protein